MRFNSNGITNADDAMVPIDNPEYYGVYEELARIGKLTLRYRGSWYIDPEKDYKKQIKEGIELSKQFKTPYWQVKSFKFFADYVIEEGTGYLSEKYNNREDEWYGIKVWEYEKLKDALLFIDKAGFQIHVHQLGDEAASYFLDVLEYVNKKNKHWDRRPSFAHVQLLKDLDKLRMAKLGVIAHTAPYWSVRDGYYEELNVPYLGKKRADNMYPVKSLIDAGVRITIHSDFSVSEPNLMEAFYKGVTRRLTRQEYLKMKDEVPERSALPPVNERVSIRDMVTAATINGAYANYLENDTGSLELGKKADFVIINRDVFNIDEELIPTPRIISTFFEGIEVYGNINSPSP